MSRALISVFTTVAWLVAVLSSATASADARISVQATDNGGYRLVLTSRERMTLEEARRRVMPMGAELCGGVPPELGESELKLGGEEGSGAPLTTTFYQDMRCVSASADGAAKTNPADNLSGIYKERVTQLAKTKTRQYLDDLANGRSEQAYALLSKDLQTQRPFARWEHALTRWRGNPGMLQLRTLQEPKIVVDPPNGRPGTYAVVKFEESFEKIPLLCGFLIWSVNNDELHIVRDAQAHISANRYKRMTVEQQKRFRRAKGCEAR